MTTLTCFNADNKINFDIIKYVKYTRLFTIVFGIYCNFSLFYVFFIRQNMRVSEVLRDRHRARNLSSPDLRRFPGNLSEHLSYRTSVS